MKRVFAALALVVGSMGSVRADTDMFHVTDAEKAACTSDAIRLCSDAYPDERKLLGCMKRNRDSLTHDCRVAFDAGVRRRHL